MDSAYSVSYLLKLKAQELGSQAALAAAIGVSPSLLTLVIQGKRNPGRKILRFLGLKRQEFYRRAGEPK